MDCRVKPGNDHRWCDAHFNQNASGSVRRVQRPPFTTARNEEFAPWCLSGPKLTSGPLKMSWYFLIDSNPVMRLSRVRFWPAFFSPVTVRSAATWPYTAPMLGSALNRSLYLSYQAWAVALSV